MGGPQPVRWLALILLICATSAVAQGDGDAAPNAATVAPRNIPQDGIKGITQPTDPGRIRASYTMAGKEVKVTEQQFYDTYLLLKPHEERKDQLIQPARIVEHMLMFAEAEALGLAPTAEEVLLTSPMRPGAMFADSMRDRLKSMGVDEASYHAYLRQTRAVQRLKDWATNDVRVRSSSAFEGWKGENQLYRVAYVEFPASAVEAELVRTGAPEADLRKFWAENVNAQNRHRCPTTVSAELLVFDPEQLTSEQTSALKNQESITRDQAFEHFRKHKDRLMNQIPSDQRPKLYPQAGQLPKLDEIVTPFELLIPVIRRELVLGDPIGSALAKARAAGTAADFAALSKEFGLKHVRLDKQDNLALTQKLPGAGPQLFTDLFGAAPGTIAANLSSNGSSQFFWRAVDRTVSALPAFEEVQSKLVTDWAHETAVASAQKSCLDFLATLEKTVAAEVAGDEARLDEEARTNAAQEIAKLSSENKDQTEMVRQKHTIFAENKKRAIRATRMAAHFEAGAAANGLKPVALAPFAFEMSYTDRSTITDPTELRTSFLRSAYQLRNMEAGQVSTLLTDVVLGSHFVVKLISKEEPPFESMPAAEYAQRSSGLERQEVYSALYRWSAQLLMQRHGWTEF